MRTGLLATMLASAIAALTVPPATAAQAAGAGCGGGLRAEADAESFAEDGARLTRETGVNFVVAASRLCAAGALRAADLAPFARLLVRNAEGAADPTVYDDAEQGPDTLILEYAFTAGAPGAAAIGTALRCWRDPARAGCDQGEE